MTDQSPALAVSDRRTRQREQRRDALFDAAMALFTERGFEGTTMDDIAERADVARGTVFNHFPQKTSFLQEWSARRRRRALDAASQAAAAGEGLRDVLVRFCTVMGEPRETSRGETAAMILGTARATNIWVRSPLADDLAAIVADSRSRGEIRGDVETDLVGQILASSYHVVLSAWASAEPAPFDLTARLVATVDLLLVGILPRG